MWGPGPTHLAHFSSALPAPTFRPAEPRAPLSLPPGGQSSWRGGVLGAGSSGGRSLGLRPRFLPLARLFSSFWGAKESWLRGLGGGSAEVRNQFWGEENSNGDAEVAGKRAHPRLWARPGSRGSVPGDNASSRNGGCPRGRPPCPALTLTGGPVSSCPSTGDRPPSQPHGPAWRPGPPTSAWALRMWYLTPLSELNSFAHSRQQYFPTRWSPCKTHAQPPHVGRGGRRQQAQAPWGRVAALCCGPLTRGQGSRPTCAHAGEEPQLAGLATD